MELFTLLAILAVSALLLRFESNKQWALQRAQENALTTGGKGTAQAGNAVTAIAGSAAALAGTIAGGTAGQAAIVAGAAVAGYSLGQAMDKWILGGDSDAVTQLAGGAAGAVIVGITAALAIGWVGGPFFAIVVAVAAFAYAVVVIVDDAEKLSYGQEGATRDYNTHWYDVYNRCFTNLRAGASPTVTDLQIERKLTPFVDGYMEQLNYLSYLQWMQSPSGVTELGLDIQGKAIHGSIRGYFVGGIEELDGKGGLVFPGNKLNRSMQPLWVRRVVPAREIQWETVTDLKGTAYQPGQAGYSGLVNTVLETKEYTP